MPSQATQAPTIRRTVTGAWMPAAADLASGRRRSTDDREMHASAHAHEHHMPTSGVALTCMVSVAQLESLIVLEAGWGWASKASLACARA